jgi:peptidoglycan DL-endopeptidase CwlO
VASHRRVHALPGTGLPAEPSAGLPVALPGDRPRVRRARRLSRLGGIAVATTAAAGLAPGIGHATPGGSGLTAMPSPAQRTEAVKQEISRLYQQAEAATEAYDGAQERITELQIAVAGEAAASERVNAAYTAATTGLGRLAAQQYRDAGLDSTFELLLSAHPDTYLQQASATVQLVTTEKDRLEDARTAARDLALFRRTSATEFQELAAARAQLAAGRAAVESRLAQAQADLAGLDYAQREQVAATLADGGYPGEGAVFSPAGPPPPLALLLDDIRALGSPDDADRVDATRAAAAVSAAYAELGKPYVWGATGPAAFDCSGLTQHVWARAGVELPRTSQEQAGISGDVPLSQIRPGDLVIYFTGQTHVGIYVGRGLVIHAPHAGAVVQFAPVASMPISKIVRPDA